MDKARILPSAAFFFVGIWAGIWINTCYLQDIAIRCPPKIDINATATIESIMEHVNSVRNISLANVTNAVTTSVVDAAAKINRKWKNVLQYGQFNSSLLVGPPAAFKKAAPLLQETLEVTVVLPVVPSPDWKCNGRNGDIILYEKSFPEHAFKAFGGETIVPFPIDLVLGSFLNVSHTASWASKLKVMETLPKLSASEQKLISQKKPLNLLQRIIGGRKTKLNHAVAVDAVHDDHFIDRKLATSNHAEDVVYQLYHMWPLPTRDFVFDRSFHVYDSNHSVIVRYASAKDGRKPKYARIIRTESPFTNWIFQSMRDYCQAHERQRSMTGAATTKNLGHTSMTDVSFLCWSTEKADWGHKTFIRLESLVLLEDVGLPFVVNFIQK